MAHFTNWGLSEIMDMDEEYFYEFHKTALDLHEEIYCTSDDEAGA